MLWITALCQDRRDRCGVIFRCSCPLPVVIDSVLGALLSTSSALVPTCCIKYTAPNVEVKSQTCHHFKVPSRRTNYKRGWTMPDVEVILFYTGTVQYSNHSSTCTRGVVNIMTILPWSYEPQHCSTLFILHDRIYGFDSTRPQISIVSESHNSDFQLIARL